MFYYAMSLVERAHYSNLTAIQRGPDSDVFSNSSGITLSQLRNFDEQLMNLSVNYGDFLFYTTLVILGLTITVFVLVFLMITLTKPEHQVKNEHNQVRQALCLILVSMNTFLMLPIIDCILRTIKSCQDDQTLVLNTVILRYAISSTTLILFLIILLYIIRVFNLYLPSELVPWCAPISMIGYVNLLAQILLVVSNVFDPNGNQILIELVALFLLFALQVGYRVLFKPMFIREVDIFYKAKEASLCLLLLIGIVCKLLQDTQNFDLVYFLALVPFTLYAQFYCEGLRMQSILEKMKTKQLKIEDECEYALYALMSLINSSLTEGSLQREAFGQMIDLMHSHIEDCEDPTCVCEEIENFYDLLQLRMMSSHQSNAPLMGEGYLRFNKIIEDHGLMGTVSSITDLTANVNSISDSHIQNQREDGDQMQNGNQQDHESQNRIFQVEIGDIKTRFLSEVMYLFCREISQKFPDSLQLAILNNHFTIHYKQREILCAFQMSAYLKHKLGMSELMQHIINQQYLLQNIETMKQAHPSYLKFKQWIGANDGDYFIAMSKLQKKFEVSIDSICITVVNFWQNFLKQEIDPDLMLLIGGEISKNIQNLFRIFIQIDEIQIIKDHQMFFKFALVQLQILNDPISYDLYIGKMKSIVDVNKVYQKTLTSGTETSNLIIVDSNSTNFGKIIQANSNLRMMLGWSEEELQSMRIEQLMPQPIKQKHNIFISKFITSGETYLMNRKTTMFIKKQNGYVIPVEFFIQFYYSVDYEYTFLAIVKPFNHMAPFKNGIQYSVEQLVFLIVENDNEGHVYDFSESCIKMLQSYGIKLNVDTGSIIRRIADLMPHFNLSEFLENRQDRFNRKEVYEGENIVDFRSFIEQKDNQGTQYQIQMENEGQLTVNTRIFEERYSGGVLDMNIFCFAFQEESQRRIGQIGQFILGSANGAAKKHSAQGQIAWNNVNEGSSVDHQHDDQNSDSLAREAEEHFSNTGSSSSYGGSKMSTNLAEFRSLHSVSEQQTPLTLLIIMRLITLLYVIMMVIASVSLAINQQKQSQAMTDVQTVTQAYFRLNWAAINQRETRILCNIANGYEPQSTNIITDDRFTAYRAMQTETISKLTATQAYLQQSSFQKSQRFLDYEASSHVPLQYLSSENAAYVTNETINTALNSFFSAANLANSYTYEQFISVINLIKIVPAPNPYFPTTQEQNLAFVIYNGVRTIRDSIFDEIQLFCDDMISHASSSTNMILITEIISMIAILAIGLVVAPMMTQVEARRYRALHYFIKIPKDKLQSMIKNCQYCAQLADENKSIQVMAEYEQIIGVKLNNEQQEKLLRKSRNQDVDGAEQKKVKVKQIENISQDSSSLDSSLANNSTQVNQKIITMQEVQQNQQFKMDQESVRQGLVEKNDSVSISEKEDSASGDDEENKEGQESAEDILNAQKMSQQTINQYLKKKRVIMATSVLVVLMMLTTYFIISYFLSIMTFNLAAELVNPLEAVLYKGSCFDQTLAFLRRNNIRNVTLNISSLTTGDLSEYAPQDLDSTTYFISFCQSLQAQYHQFNIALPPYFKDAAQIMNDLELVQVCDLVYVGQFASLNKMCKTGLDGLFQQGLTNTFFYMFRVVQMQNMQFTELGPTWRRNASILEAMEGDPLILEIIDFKATVLDPVIAVLKDTCMQSIVNYIQSLLNNFMIAFIVFVVILSVGMIFLFTVGFRSLKRNMLDTNIMLRIIPFEKLEKRDREEVIQFFRN